MTDPSLALHLAQFAANTRRRLGAQPARKVLHDGPARRIDLDRTVRTLLSAAWIR